MVTACSAGMWGWLLRQAKMELSAAELEARKAHLLAQRQKIIEKNTAMRQKQAAEAAQVRQAEQKAAPAPPPAPSPAPSTGPRVIEVKPVSNSCFPLLLVPRADTASQLRFWLETAVPWGGVHCGLPHLMTWVCVCFQPRRKYRRLPSSVSHRLLRRKCGAICFQGTNNDEMCVSSSSSSPPPS